MLTRREYSVAELRGKLAATGARPEEVDATIEDLLARKLVSDARYADALVRTKLGRGHSSRAITHALRAAGVPQDDAQVAMASAEIDDQAGLVALWRRRFGKVPVDDRERARQVRFLQSRGFALSAILKLLHAPPHAASDEP